MATLMVCPTQGTGGWQRGTPKHGKVSKSFRSKVNRHNLRCVELGEGLKACARRLAAMESPNNDMMVEIQLLAQQWLKNKGTK